ncbi:LysR family transcriptional regulator [Shewanella sp. 202IG2-18]|uniref:LysR family transcriptional regulator n=1 Tax=Parashewanella hymeniacidonis TaxID=2807618 RepID=UPI00196084CE|nr:LysR family transcriptional regulator [Parashewanella hymeniacidonis]MBM7074619.1 LysR family transcriptional regulator [Parashewanella hymeniacidonis]
MNSSSFNQLQTFHAILEEGSITGAAKKLEIAPPSVSQSLKNLEKHLGLPLFTRSTRRIELTEAGSLLYQKTVNALNELNDAFDSIEDLNEVPSGKVKLTIPRFAYQFFLQPLYVEFCERYPNIQLEVSVSDEAVNIIAEGIDVGIRFGDRVEEGMVARPITKPMKEALFASQSYVDKHGVPNSIEELQKHKLIQYRFIASNQLAPLKITNGKEVFNVEMPLAMIVNDTDLMIDATINGLGIGRVITPMVNHLFEQGKVIPILEPHWCPYSGLHLYFNQNTQKAKRVRVLVDFLIEKAAATL